MTVVLVVIAVAVVVGLLRGGSIATLSDLDLRGARLVVVAVALQLVGAFGGALGVPGGRARYVVAMTGSALLVVAFVARNRWLPGMPLVALGFSLNALVVVLNGAMPVDPAAMERAGLSPTPLYDGGDSKHEPLDDSTRLRLLADVIPVPLPLPVGSNVVSVGDVVLAAGIGVLVLRGMLPESTGRHARRTPLPAGADNDGRAVRAGPNAPAPG